MSDRDCRQDRTGTGGDRGQLFVVSAPSGAGKTSLVKALTEHDSAVQVSVSHTTRVPRKGEIDGVNYHFIDAAEFEHMRDAGEFLEHAEIYGHGYGTARQHVQRVLDQGTDLVLEIDWQGAAQIRGASDEVLTIFILPPSLSILRQRLEGRGLDDARVIEQRMAAAIDEMEHFHEFDYVVVNDDFQQALADLRSIVGSNRLRQQRQRQRQRRVLAALELEKAIK